MAQPFSRLISSYLMLSVPNLILPLADGFAIDDGLVHLGQRPLNACTSVLAAAVAGHAATAAAARVLEEVLEEEAEAHCALHGHDGVEGERLRARLCPHLRPSHACRARQPQARTLVRCRVAEMQQCWTSLASVPLAWLRAQGSGPQLQAIIHSHIFLGIECRHSHHTHAAAPHLSER